MDCKESYELGRQAYLRGAGPKPMRDHTFVSLIQGKGSAAHHPNSPGAEMNDAQRRNLEDQLHCWSKGWQDAQEEDKK